MAETYGFFDGLAYTADQFQQFLRAISGQGVVAGYLNGLSPSAGPGRAVTLASGYAIAGNHWYLSTANVVKSIAANAHATNNRWDLVVVRYNATGSTVGTVANNTVGIDVLQGTAAASPTEPVPTQTTTLYEVPIVRAIPALSSGSSVTIVDRRQYGAPPLHDILTGHTATGLTAGHILKATGASSFGFVAHAVPGARAFHSAAQSIPNAALTVLALNSDRFDTDTMHDPVTNNARLTINTPGWYVFTACVEFAASATGQRQLSIRRNSAGYVAQVFAAAVGGGLTTRLVATTIYYCAAAEWVDMEVYQDSGGALNVNSASSYSPELSAVWIGA